MNGSLAPPVSSTQIAFSAQTAYEAALPSTSARYAARVPAASATPAPRAPDGEAGVADRLVAGPGAHPLAGPGQPGQVGGADRGLPALGTAGSVTSSRNRPG